MKRIVIVIVILLTSLTIAGASFMPSPLFESKGKEIVNWVCIPYKQPKATLEECKEIVFFYEQAEMMGFGYAETTKTVVIVVGMPPKFEITAQNMIGAALVGLKIYPGSEKVLIFYGEILVHQFIIDGESFCYREM